MTADELDAIKARHASRVAAWPTNAQDLADIAALVVEVETLTAALADFDRRIDAVREMCQEPSQQIIRLAIQRDEAWLELAREQAARREDLAAHDAERAKLRAEIAALRRELKAGAAAYWKQMRRVPPDVLRGN